LKPQKGLKLIESVGKGQPSRSLVYVATVPLWAVYTVAAHVGPGKEIVVLGGCSEENRAVSVYIREAA
jgi:hypothetical protein